MNLLVRNGRVIDPANAVDGVADVLILDGRVSRVGSGLAGPAGVPVPTLDATDRVVVPGLIDMHAHLREPGQEYKETIATGTRAAAAGGFTAVCAMANTQPPIDDAPGVAYVVRRARETGVVNVKQIGAVSRKLKSEELAEIGSMKVEGIVAVSDDGRPIAN